MLNICLFGGPGVGKSTVAAGLFFEMKMVGINAEYIQEYAKELYYSDDKYRIEDQLYILAKQHHNWFRMEGKVDYLIHDSPFLLSVVYRRENGHLPEDLFEALIIEIFKSYETLNIFIEREDSEYKSCGRYETLEQARQRDVEIKALLDKHGIEYHVCKKRDVIEWVMKQ